MKFSVLSLLVLAGGLASSQAHAEDPELQRYRDLLGRIGSVEASAPAVAVPADSSALERRLRVAASLEKLLEAPKSPESKMIPAPPAESPGMLATLSIARSFAHLGLQDEARSWYDQARAHDTDGQYAAMLMEEELAAASADSTALLTTLSRLAAGALPRDDAQLATFLETLILWDLVEPALDQGRDLLAHKQLGPRSRFQVARMHQTAGDAGVALRGYRTLLAEADRLPRVDQIALARGLADLYFSRGDRSKARTYYRELQRLDVGVVAAWATFQLGVLAQLRSDYGDAVEQFRSLCEREATTPWREEACWQLNQAERLFAIKNADTKSERSGS